MERKGTGKQYLKLQLSRPRTLLARKKRVQEIERKKKGAVKKKVKKGRK